MSDSRREEEPPTQEVFSPASAQPASAAPWQSLSPGQTLAGRYTVLEQLGQGGMGVVFAAYDVRLDRRVALKLLQPARTSRPEDQARLAREAQAMARLSHPNVVHVYDAGTLENGHLFIAMEYVEGQTLKAWCQQSARSWREILEAYLAAGRGLDAAHRAGIVHRDFKPDNVLIGHDGRVRVMDFGLARAEPSMQTSASQPEHLPPSAWEQALTVPGTVMGTLRYMAPELIADKPADTRSDLFSFCVSLYEALFRQAPYDNASLQARTEAMAEGRLLMPSSSEVPGWVLRPLLQGLQVAPERRPASMQALVAALEADPAERRRSRLRTGGLALLAAVATGLAVAGGMRWQEQGCAGLERRLDGVWDEPVRARVRTALLSAQLPYAQDTYERVAQALDRYTGTWVRLRTEACEAGRAQAGQPRGLAVLQEYCLERRRSQVRALTELLSQGPDKELVPKAVQAVQALAPLEYCTEARALLAAVPPPEEPTVRARAEALQEQVDRLEALYAAGKFKEGLSLADPLLKETAQVGHAPLHARTLFEAARLREGSGDYSGSEALSRQAIALAAQGKDDVLEARAWSQLVTVVGTRLARHQEALALELSLEAAVSRADDDVVRSSWLNTWGSLLLHAGKPEQAQLHYERALALRMKILGPMHPEVAAVVNNLGLALQAQAESEQARAHFERALAIREKALGATHPMVANVLNNLGSVLKNMGQLAQSRTYYERALALQEQTLGPNHPMVANSLNNLGLVLLDLTQYPEAQEHFERALAIRQQLLGPEHPDVSSALNNLGISLQRRGQLDRAREHFERAIELDRKVLAPEHFKQGFSLYNLGTLLLEQGQYAQARVLLERAASVWQKALGPEHPDSADALCALGRTLVGQRQLEPARRHLERSLAILEKTQGQTHSRLVLPLLGLGELLLARGQPAQAVAQLERALALCSMMDVRAEVQLTLAQALLASGLERHRAVELATGARDYYQRIGNPSGLARASRWLQAHASP
ncbi:MAG TPA: serine/threonine-protein kinase [Myxococcaceae bacterium]|nr:serine/threonine-protein kinase [Myxococcaceae bacterium]